MSRLSEFFEAKDRRLGMAQLLRFLAYPPATYMAVNIGTTESMSFYLMAFVVDGGLSKGLDVWRTKVEKNATTHNKRV